jgi:hypothetical protein
MEPSERRAFPPAEAGGLLCGVTGLSIGLGCLLGWLGGSIKIGLIAGAVLGIPAGIGAVYIRYHDSFA